MKRKVFKSMCVALLAGVTLTGCTLPFGQIMDGDGMINENPNIDPIKNPSGDENEHLDEVSLYEEFVKGEKEASIGDALGKDVTGSFDIDGIIRSGAEYLLSYYAYDEPYMDYTYTSSYAIIDCGADDVKELALKVDYQIIHGSKENNYSSYTEMIFVFKNDDEDINCIYAQESQARDYWSINEYGYLTEEGSGGANIYVQGFRFLDAEGKLVYNYDLEAHMCYAEPMIPKYCLPESLREGLYEENFSPESNYYNALIYNFEEHVQYPEYDYETASQDYIQQMQDKFDKEYNERLAKNVYAFEDQDGKDAAPSGNVKAILDAKGIKYYSQAEVNKMIDEHEKNIGLDSKIKNGKEPDWKDLSGNAVSNDVNGDTEATFIGEYVDDNKDPSLEIAKRSDGKFDIQISIFRLCSLDDGIGELQEDKIVFSVTDPNGNPMEGVITRDGDKAVVEFTKTTWTYISNGDKYTFVKKADEANLWETY